GAGGAPRAVPRVGGRLGARRVGAHLDGPGLGEAAGPHAVTPATAAAGVDGARPTRRYDSALRRERALATRARIVTAGCELLQASSLRDWRGVTIRAVAERAGVNERTVYRHFG